MTDTDMAIQKSIIFYMIYVKVSKMTIELQEEDFHSQIDFALGLLCLLFYYLVHQN